MHRAKFVISLHDCCSSAEVGPLSPFGEQVDADDVPRIQVLDAQGKVVAQLPPG